LLLFLLGPKLSLDLGLALTDTLFLRKLLDAKLFLNPEPLGFFPLVRSPRERPV
jgi:hypothetical protein